MPHAALRDFSALYRAAFAEVDPETKQVLLARVQKAISVWEEEATFDAQRQPATTMRSQPVRLEDDRSLASAA
jgi:phage baseplate assembly protein W